ncbi:MAG TPA: DUF2092 domain-containing protein [Candidatus Limnocylindrales bacterium]|jgi:hypothetical protein|nr:DUF2092 domain-containing protein [Candidatus Limnocylindrales bacterium]
MMTDKFPQWRLPLVLGLVCLAGTVFAQTAQQTKKETAPPAKPAPTAAPPALEPKALAILKASSDRLAAAHTLAFTAVETYESPSRQGHPLVFVNKSEVTLQRPDKLRVITPGDGPASEFYYNGKTMTAFAPAENLIAVADAPPTIDAAMEAAYRLHGTYFPFDDLIVADPYKDMAEGLKLAYYIGQSHVVGDTTTDMVAYVDNGVFIEIWIGVEDKLPRLIHAVYLDDPAQLRHNLLLSDWKLDLSVPADAFAPANAAGAKHIPFAHPHPLPPPGAQPPVKSEPPKAQQ